MGAKELCSVDGSIAPTERATVPLKDDGLYRGDGAFEVIRLYRGTPFALTEHLDRLHRSAAALELEFDREALEHEIAALLAEFGEAEAQLRLIVTRGGRRIAATEPLPEHAETVALASVTYSPTVVLNGVKSLSYAANMQATRLARSTGADEAVFVTPEGAILEAPTSTLFWVSADDGTLRTTALSAGVLESITRDRLIRELHVEEGTWPLDDLRAAREAFLASTVREVQAVSSLDGQPFPSAPGPRTEEAAAAFAGVLERQLGT
ncbi:MAG: aminotransferase class IV [Solirubrobacterales bacterium]